MPASMSLQTVKGNEKWFLVVSCFWFWVLQPCSMFSKPWKFNSAAHSNRLLTFDSLIKPLSTIYYLLISSDTGKNGLILIVSLLKEQPNDQPNYALQPTTAYMYLSSKSNGFALSLPPFFPVCFRIYTNNQPYQPYTMIHQKHFQNAKQCY